MRIETNIPQRLPDGHFADVTMFGNTETGEIEVAWVKLDRLDQPGDCGVYGSISFRLSGQMKIDFFYWWGYDLSQPDFTP